MKKIGIFILMISIFGTTFFISNKLSAQVEPLEPLPTKSFRVVSNQGPFAGRILNTKATRIQELENAKFFCPTAIGRTIEIKKQKETHKYPTSYYINDFVKSKYPRKPGQAILGYYSGTITITCTHPEGAVATVILNTISKYAVSKDALSLISI